MIDEMTEWPFSQHDDIPDAISDLDKTNKDQCYYCPQPPAGWRQAAAVRQQPSMINGRLNPDLGYPARDNIRAEQQGAGAQADLWKPSNQQGSAYERPMAPGQEIFRRR